MLKKQEKYNQFLRWAGWNKDSERGAPWSELGHWPSAKGLLHLPWEAKLGTWVSFLQLSECQGQGTDARPGHPGMSGKAPWTASVDRSGECLTFWMQNTCQAAKCCSQGWGTEEHCVVAALGCTGSVWWEMASAEVTLGNWNPVLSGWYLSCFKKHAYIFFHYLLTYILNLARGFHMPKLALM